MKNNFHLSVVPTVFHIFEEGKDTYNVTNYNHFIFSSNHDNCLRLGEYNRRHQIFKVNSNKIGDFKYFDNLFATFNKRTGSVFYSYLYHLDLSNLPNPRKIIVTDLMEEIIKLSRSPTETFISDVVEGEYKISASINTTRLDKDCKCSDYTDCSHVHGISKQEFYKAYSSWCKENGYKASANTYFAMDVKKKLEEAPRKHGGSRAWKVKSISLQVMNDLFISRGDPIFLTY